MRMYTLIILIVITLVFTLSACKIRIQTPSGGEVVTESGSWSCASDSSCTIDVYDTFFDETFRAVPNHGFEFIAWHKMKGGLCGLSTKPCELATASFQNHPALLQVLESDKIFHLRPVFIKHGQDAFWPDGIYNYDDAWAAEALWKETRVFDPHLWQKAFRIPDWALTIDQYAYLTEFTWWGFYASGALPPDTDQLPFDLIFYADDFGKPGKVITRRRIQAGVEPQTNYGSSEQRTIRSMLPEYDGLPLYEFHRKLNRPLHLPRGDMWFSIIQVNAQGAMDPDFIWHGDISSRIGTISFLTDYGGWINASYRAGISGRVDIRGYVEGWY